MPGRCRCREKKRKDREKQEKSASDQKMFELKEFYGKGSFEQAIDVLMTQLNAPLIWNDWQALTTEIGKLYGQKFTKRGECRSLYEAKARAKFGDDWRTLVPTMVATFPGEKIFEPKDFHNKDSFEQAIDVLMTQLDVPLSWNYWQSLTTAIGKFHGKTYAKGECRSLYEAKQKAKFGDIWRPLVPTRVYKRSVPTVKPTNQVVSTRSQRSVPKESGASQYTTAPNKKISEPKTFHNKESFEQAIDLLMTQPNMPLSWKYWLTLTSAIGQLYGKTYAKGERRSLYEAKQKAKFGDNWRASVPTRVNRRSFRKAKPTDQLPIARRSKSKAALHKTGQDNDKDKSDRVRTAIVSMTAPKRSDPKAKPTDQIPVAKRSKAK